MVPPLRGYRIFEDSLWDVSCWGVLRITSIKDYHQKIEIKLWKSHITLQKREWGATRTASYTFKRERIRGKGWPDASAKTSRRSFQRYFGINTAKWKPGRVTGRWVCSCGEEKVPWDLLYSRTWKRVPRSEWLSVISTSIDSSNHLIGVSRTILDSGRLNVPKIRQIFS